MCTLLKLGTLIRGWLKGEPNIEPLSGASSDHLTAKEAT